MLNIVQVVSETQSGGIVFNDTFQYLAGAYGRHTHIRAHLYSYPSGSERSTIRGGGRVRL
jgi:hypothetical protein